MDNIYHSLRCMQFTAFLEQLVDTYAAMAAQVKGNSARLMQARL
jgi:hypothetical protein